MRTILLLILSNIFMTFAWYGHLKYRSAALWKVVHSSPSWDDMQPFAQASLKGVTEPLGAAPEMIRF